MRMRDQAKVLLLVLLSWSSSAGAMDDLRERAAIAAESRAHLLRGEYDLLDADATRFRTEKSRTSSGLWKLASFYDGIDGAATAAQRGPQPDVSFGELEKRIDEWARLFPDSPSPGVARGIAWLARAWAARGTGYSSTVAPDAWPVFRAHLATARQHLEEAKTISAIDPEWYAVSLRTGTAENWDRNRFDALTAEALDREPLYYSTYFAAVEYLLPKWHGDFAQVEAFARAAVARSERSEGRGMYARIYWVAYDDQFRNALFRNSLAAWPLMVDGFEDMLQRYPDAWNINTYAKFACLAGDKAKAGELLLRVGRDVVPEAWSPRSLLKECSQWALTSS